MKINSHRIILILFLACFGYLYASSLNTLSVYIKDMITLISSNYYPHSSLIDRLSYFFLSNSYQIIVGITIILVLIFAYRLGRVNRKDNPQSWEFYFSIVAVNFGILILADPLSNLDLIFLINLCLVPFYISFIPRKSHY